MDAVLHALSAAGSRLERMPKADATELAPKKSVRSPSAHLLGPEGFLALAGRRAEPRTFLPAAEGV